ncbi:hypothetical protein [Burkholderia sp. BDU5]|uniref:hypothetical protein n=1 Tax=Burkholderia sp. BDU5 TaxID=1385590 RepID=UPI000A4F2FBB|nr:hypothetical protein [Burkholderia sp. BDU5]
MKAAQRAARRGRARPGNHACTAPNAIIAAKEFDFAQFVEIFSEYNDTDGDLFSN